MRNGRKMVISHLYLFTFVLFILNNSKCLKDKNWRTYTNFQCPFLCVDRFLKWNLTLFCFKTSIANRFLFFIQIVQIKCCKIFYWWSFHLKKLLVDRMIEKSVSAGAEHHEFNSCFLTRVNPSLKAK